MNIKKKIFLEKVGVGRKKGRKRNIHPLPLINKPQPGTEPTTQACALAGNQMGDPLPNPPPGQGSRNFIQAVLKIDIDTFKNSTSQSMSGESRSFLLLPVSCGLVLLKKYNKDDTTMSNCYEVPKCLLPLLINIPSPRPAPITGHTGSHVLLVFLRGGRART